MNKIIFISSRYFTKNDFYRFGIIKYLENKINVEVWYLNKLIKRNYKIKEFGLKKVKIKKINDIHEFENQIKENKVNCVYDLRIAYNFSNKKIFQLLSKYDANYLIYLRGDIYKYKIKFLNYLKYQFKNIINGELVHLKKIILNKIFLSLSSSFWGIKKAKYVCLIGKYAYIKRKKHKLIGIKTKLIWGQHRDNDDYLRNNAKKTKTQRKKALFIDSAAPYHPDTIDTFTDINPIKYYNSIKNFLEKLNKNFGYEIEISCHPKLKIKKIKKHFPNHRIKVGDTISQIRNSSIIITHDSNAINFAVIYKKPIIFITNNSLSNSAVHHNELIDMRAKLFNKKSVNIDVNSIIDITKYLKINKRVYRNYLNNYIKAKGPRKIQADITINKFKKDRIWV